MTTSVSRSTKTKVDYPTSDGRPMAETEVHRDLMMAQIETLKRRFIADPLFYVSGNMLVYYQPGDRLCHVAPDVFVVRGVPKHRRDYYLIWEEKRSLDLAMEITSRSTRAEDVDDKFVLYRDRLKVSEYFLFDPYNEYLDPPLQGYRLNRGRFLPIKPVDGRLPSKVLGLHLERDARDLRLYDPASGKWLLTPQEELFKAQEGLALADVKLEQEKIARKREEIGRKHEEIARKQVEADNEKLRLEIEALRKRLNGGNK